MGPFEWLAGRWTPEFEYRDRLADEVEDIAYESTRIGTRRGFLMGVLVGGILVLIGIAVIKISGLETRSPTIAAEEQSLRGATSPQPVSEEMTLLRRENEQLRAELTRTKTAGAVSAPEERTAEAKVPAKKEAPVPKPAKAAARRPAAKPGVTPRASVTGVAQPIPSNCRQEGECDPAGQ